MTYMLLLYMPILLNGVKRKCFLIWHMLRWLHLRFTYTNGSGFKIGSGGTQRFLFLRGSSHQKPQRYFLTFRNIYCFTGDTLKGIYFKSGTTQGYSLFLMIFLKYIHSQNLRHADLYSPHSEVMQSKSLTFSVCLCRWPGRITSWGLGSTF